jgi:uncharacterized protein YkwD
MRSYVRRSRFVSLCLLPFLSVLAHPAFADGEQQLAQAINSYRAHPQRCEGRSYPALPPLVLKSALALPAGYGGGLRDALRARGYQATTVQAVEVVGAGDARSALLKLQDEYCDTLLDAQSADIGVSRSGSHWQVVVARPTIDPHLSNQQTADKSLLAQVNAARSQPRMCGYRSFAAARPLTWSNALGLAAQGHSRSMASENYFAHDGLDGDTPSDRARSAGYRGRQVGENIAAGQGSPSQAMQSWLASPGHCANLMNPRFTQVGAAYATGAQSELGIYWTMVFGAP